MKTKLLILIVSTVIIIWGTFYLVNTIKPNTWGLIGIWVLAVIVLRLIITPLVVMIMNEYNKNNRNNNDDF